MLPIEIPFQTRFVNCMVFIVIAIPACKVFTDFGDKVTRENAMHFYLSSNAMQDMKIRAIQPASVEQKAFCEHWYVHRVLIERRKHVIAMESHSRYAMVFCGLTQPAFKRFPELFADYLWRHIVSLCDVPDADFGRIKQLAAAMCCPIVYHKGLSKSVQAHIKDAAHQLEYDIYRYGFPSDPGQEFYLSMKVNKAPRSKNGEKECLWPLEVFQQAWCERLGVKPVKE